MNRGLSKKWFLLAIVLVLLVGAWLLFRSVFAPRISPESYARIQMGMTRDEVEAILGPSENHHPMWGPG